MPPINALTAAQFSIIVDGYSVGSFSELVGITTEVEPFDFDSTDQVVGPRKLLGKPKPPTVVLKRGQTPSMELWNWHEAVVSGNMAAARKDCTLVMYAVDGKPVARYQLFKAWPSKLEIVTLKGGPTEALFETVTLVCERLQRLAV
ncbi:phage tail protein [Actinopolymorpha pittospori]|uniref:Phage tail-like protein n=1 Tax=Actinopolymorpha pittospori TaxID=648752 RepID=A0A927RJN5_9ACTN|nr:phage tail protein [Actinopolymorpha pittospori]MBE1605838.1 phage tail-like protein [Actinopolymorpha pittospori]